jgi:hypothetical protein
METKRNAYRISVETPQQKKPLGRLKRRGAGNISNERINTEKCVAWF